MANLAPCWKPKGLQNRGQDAKKSMFENNTFLALILEGLGPRFGRVLGRFFEPKMHTKGDVQKIVLCPRNHSFNGSELMSASLQQSIFRAKIDKKSHACRDIDFAGILEGFWQGSGRPKISIFALFSSFCRSKFWKTF